MPGNLSRHIASQAATFNLSYDYSSQINSGLQPGSGGLITVSTPPPLPECTAAPVTQVTNSSGPPRDNAR